MRYDLFGNLVLDEKPRARGRPKHVPTIANHNRILLWAATGKTEQECAAAIGISMPTLRKHYFSALSVFARSAMLLRGELLVKLLDQANDGNVAAIKELGKEIERGELRALGERVKGRGQAEKSDKPERPVGLKEMRKQAAQDVVGLFKPRSAPSGLMN